MDCTVDDDNKIIDVLHSDISSLDESHHNVVILNDRLKWDGSHLGSYMGVITHKWVMDGMHYYGITLSPGWSMIHPMGIIYCNATCTNNVLPCIVEDIKNIFGIHKRGIHRIKIDNKEYLIYYVPISLKGEVIWETPLNKLDNKDILRSNPDFRKEIQKIMAFCDILALCNTRESSIRIRLGVNGSFIPINTNESTTTIQKGTMYDYNILSKTIFSKWFGEETSINDIVRDMVSYKSKTSDIPAVKVFFEENNQLTIITSEIRSKIDNIIKRYDVNYVWYSNFIIDRMSRYLLA